MRFSQTLLDLLAKYGNPVIDKDRATLFWKGDEPPTIMTDYSDWEMGDPIQFTKLKEGLWAHEVKLPENSYIEYAFFRGEERIPDPLNPRTTPNGLGDINHYFFMPEYLPHNLYKRIRNNPRGKVFQEEVPVDMLLAGITRTVYFYQPPTDQPVPLVVVYDGHEYLNRAKLPVILDNLIANNLIHPVALAMIKNSHRYRTMEYACSESTLLFLIKILMPFAQKKLNLLDIASHPGAFGIIGASFGGLMTLYTALRLPHIFGHALVQSGAFGIIDHNFVVWDMLKALQPDNLKIFMDCGRFEWLTPINRTMAEYLKSKIPHYSYHEYNGGHNYPSWRNDLPRGLKFLYGK